MTVRKITRCFGCGRRAGGEPCNCGEYPEIVRRHFDPARPKYTVAVKAIAASAKGDSYVEMLIGRLADACNEAEENAA